MADRLFVKFIEVNDTSDLSLALGKSHRFSWQGARKKSKYWQSIIIAKLENDVTCEYYQAQNKLGL